MKPLKVAQEEKVSSVHGNNSSERYRIGAEEHRCCLIPHLCIQEGVRMCCFLPGSTLHCDTSASTGRSQLIQKPRKCSLESQSGLQHKARQRREEAMELRPQTSRTDWNKNYRHCHLLVIGFLIHCLVWWELTPKLDRTQFLGIYCLVGQCISFYCCITNCFKFSKLKLQSCDRY